MTSFAFLQRPAIFAAVLLPLLASTRTGAVARGQDSKPVTATPMASAATTDALTFPPVEGTGEQMRAISAVCDLWEARRLAEVKRGVRKISPNAPQDSLDIRDYNFAIKQENDAFKVTLTPRKPAVLKTVTPQGTLLMNNSSTFFYDVRRRDFKIIGVAAIL